MLSPAIFAAGLIKVHEELEKVVGFDFPKIKCAVLTVLLETLETPDPLSLDGKYSNATLHWCLNLRETEPFVGMTADEEKLIYKTLLKIYKIK